MHKDSLYCGHSSGIAIMYLIQVFHARIIEQAVPQKSGVLLGGYAKQLSISILQAINTLDKLGGRRISQQ